MFSFWLIVLYFHAFIQAHPIRFLHGSCDASGAIVLNSEQFATVSDEDQVIRVFSAQNPQELRHFDLSKVLGHGEADLEAGARSGNLLFWIGSHSSDKKGRYRPSRHVFFAWRIEPDEAIAPQGLVYRTLIRDAYARHAAYFPDTTAINIEGLAISEDSSAWIGLRAPLYRDSALILILGNPRGVIRGEPADWKRIVPLYLAGQGIRSLEWDSRRGIFWILSGSSERRHTDSPILWRWNGKTQNPPVRVETNFYDLNPEALIIIRDSLFIFSDDGEYPPSSVSCKALPKRVRKARWISLAIPKAF